MLMAEYHSGVFVDDLCGLCLLVVTLHQPPTARALLLADRKVIPVRGCWEYPK